MFSDEYQSYQPLLSEIKREFESCIENLKTELGMFEVVKANFSVLEFKTGKEITNVRNEYELLVQEKE
jgi:hypothetical protein